MLYADMNDGPGGRQQHAGRCRCGDPQLVDAPSVAGKRHVGNPALALPDLTARTRQHLSRAQTRRAVCPRITRSPARPPKISHLDAVEATVTESVDNAIALGRRRDRLANHPLISCEGESR